MSEQLRCPCTPPLYAAACHLHGARAMLEALADPRDYHTVDIGGGRVALACDWCSFVQIAEPDGLPDHAGWCGREAELALSDHRESNGASAGEVEEGS